MSAYGYEPIEDHWSDDYGCDEDPRPDDPGPVEPPDEDE